MAGIIGGIFLVLVCLDMGIKQYIDNSWKEGEERETLIPRLVLRKVYNRGFALNALEKRPEIVRGVSGAACLWVFLYDLWLFLQKGKRLRKLGMALVSAGAVSNTYDRLVRRKVIDYIGFRTKFQYLSQLTANLADFYVAAGAALVFLCNVGKRKKR